MLQKSVLKIASSFTKFKFSSVSSQAVAEYSQNQSISQQNISNKKPTLNDYLKFSSRRQFKVVEDVESQLLLDTTLNKEYGHLQGSPLFLKKSSELVFGTSAKVMEEGKVGTFQTLGGSGSLKQGFDFIRKWIPSNVVIVNPGWRNYSSLISSCGLTSQQLTISQDQPEGQRINSLIDYLNSAPKGTIILLQSHHDSADAFSMNQLKKIAEVIKDKQLFPFFDLPYQGLESGSLNKDASVIRYFAQQGIELGVAQSYSYNMGLKRQRVGAFHLVTKQKANVESLISQLNIIVRSNYGFSPLHGARIVQKILSSQNNTRLWNQQLKQMTTNYSLLRQKLRSKLLQKTNSTIWNKITQQTGSFIQLDLSEDLKYVKTSNEINNGIIPLSMLNNQSINFVSNFIAQTYKKKN